MTDEPLAKVTKQHYALQTVVDKMREFLGKFDADEPGQGDALVEVGNAINALNDLYSKEGGGDEGK